MLGRQVEKERIRRAGIIYDKGAWRQGGACVVVADLRRNVVGDPSIFGTELGHEGLARRDVGEWAM